MKKVLKLNGLDIEVDSSGNCFRNVTTNHIYKISINSSGYSYISLFNKGKRKNYLSHRLVALAFIPNPENKPQVNHIDEKISNNDYSNLEWSTTYENSHYGLHIDNVKLKLQEVSGYSCVLTLHNESNKNLYFNSIRDASKYLNMSNGSLVGQINKNNGIYKIKRKNITISLSSQ